MPWYLAFLLPVFENIIVNYGVPALEARFPGLTPLVGAILNALKGHQLPSTHATNLKLAAAHFIDDSQTVGLS